MSESEFTLLNYHRLSHPDVGLTNLCLCCLEKDVTFVNLSTCKHFGILKNLCSIPKMELGRFVCLHCHAKLETIYDFKLQAEKSFNILWSRQYSETIRPPKLVKEAIYLEYYHQGLLTDQIATKPVKDYQGVASACWLNNPDCPPEENHVKDYKFAVSGCWFNNPHYPPGNGAQTDQNMSEVKIKKEVDKDLEINEETCVAWNSRPQISKILTTVTNYHYDVSELHIDSPQYHEVQSDLDTDDVPLAKIKREVEIEVPQLQKHERASGARRRQFAYIEEEKPTNAAVFTEKAVFHCTECSKKFASKRTLRAHNLKMHNHPKKVFKPKRYFEDYAGIIKLITLTHEELMLEREIERNSKMYLQKLHRCDLCIVSFNHEQVLRDHNKKHQLIANSFQCGICMTVFGAHYVMKAHEKKHYTRYECSVCQKRYSSLDAIVDHYNRLHEAKNKITYSCSLCDHTTTTHRSHAYHIEKHKGKSLCLLCSSTFATKASLRTHMLRVHGKSKDKATAHCKECNKTFSSKHYLTVHNKAKHTPTSLQAPYTDDINAYFYCAACNIFFMSDKELQNHLKRHRNHRSDNDKKFTCDICKERFFTKGQIQAHISWLHLKISEFTCSQCHKSYESRSRLNKHVRYVHEKIRPPRDKMCDYCGKGFQTPAILRSHIRRHTGERPYQCPHCPSTFAHSGALYTHNKLLHSGTRKQK